jgi:PPK2 family polyphosphate:nucleotide phosphotransferase
VKPNGEQLFRVEPGRRIRLEDYDSASTPGYAAREDAVEKLAADLEKLAALQDVFAAERSHALLIIFQGSDASGKDGAVKHVLSGMNALGVMVTSFKAPSEEERSHDFLWRSSKALPERGHIGIFNRSYYEEVGVVRVHPEVAAAEGQFETGKRVWRKRFEDIAAFERHLTQSGTLVVKFFLNVSKEEQRQRLLERIEDPQKQWKIDASDLRERNSWHAYRDAYSDMLTHTNTAYAPWYVVPADHKWFARLTVAEILVRRLKALRLEYPRVTAERRAFLHEARASLAE